MPYPGKIHAAGEPLARLMKLTDALLAEHAVFHTMFDTIERSSQGVLALSEIKILTRLLRSVLEKHAQAEHELLFPAIEAYLDHIGQLKKFHLEDDMIVKNLDLIEDQTSADEARTLLLRAVQLAREHFEKEERIIFPIAIEHVSARSLEELGELWYKVKNISEPSKKVRG